MSIWSKTLNKTQQKKKTKQREPFSYNSEGSPEGRALLHRICCLHLTVRLQHNPWKTQKLEREKFWLTQFKVHQTKLTNSFKKCPLRRKFGWFGWCSSTKYKECVGVGGGQFIWSKSKCFYGLWHCGENSFLS